MNPHTLPVKRRPVPKGIFKRLSAVTGNRKQRVAATAAAEMDADDGSSKISRALTIIFLIHVVAIGLIFVHQKFLEDRTPAGPLTAKAGKAEAVAPAPRRSDLPKLSSGDKGYVVQAGDNYTRIAAAEGVAESDLRLLNQHVDIGPNVILRIPPPKRVVAVEAPSVAVIRDQSPPGDDMGLVEALPVDAGRAPRAQLVRPNIARAAQAAVPAAAPGKTYIVQDGDSVWRVANHFKVNRDALMKANGISDARKMKVGMSLVIP